MTFMRARTKEQVAQRRDKIIGIAISLYDDGGYDAVNFSRISELTSITRPAIYSYFKSADDILLAALGNDFDEVNALLEASLKSHKSLDTDEFATVLYEALVSHKRMLKMLSINYSIIEVRSSMDSLVYFKSKIMKTFSLLADFIEKFFPHKSKEERSDFGFIFFSFLSSAFILTNPSEKQLAAITANDDSFKVPDFDSLFLKGLKVLSLSLKK